MPLLFIVLLWAVGIVFLKVAKRAWNAIFGSLNASRVPSLDGSGRLPNSAFQPSATGSSLWSRLEIEERRGIAKPSPLEQRRMEARWRQQADQAEFLSIPADLRRDALFWMLKDEILQRWRRGSLESHVAHLFEVNDVPRPESGPCRDETDTRRCEPTARESSDATVDYWWAYRENGRYGAHPSHDDYSDEGVS